MKARRGLALAEVIVAAVVAMLVLYTFLTVFQSSYQYASQTRNRMIAIQLQHTWMAEIAAHPYGVKAPPNWADGPELPVEILLEGKPLDLTFHRKISYRTGSFVDGARSENYDVVTVAISWRENIGNEQKAEGRDNKSLEVQVPVWR